MCYFFFTFGSIGRISVFSFCSFYFITTTSLPSTVTIHSTLEPFCDFVSNRRSVRPIKLYKRMPFLNFVEYFACSAFANAAQRHLMTCYFLTVWLANSATLHPTNMTMIWHTDICYGWHCNRQRWHRKMGLKTASVYGGSDFQFIELWCSI